MAGAGVQTTFGAELSVGSTATPFSTLFWALHVPAWDTALSQLADNIEWTMMANNEVHRGKSEVVSFLKPMRVAADRRPECISNLATKEWGVFEYWNNGTITPDVAGVSEVTGLIPEHQKALIGRRYRVGVCFVFRLNAQQKIDIVREYLDFGFLDLEPTRGIA